MAQEDDEKSKCAASGEASDLNETKFTKLDELLTQTQLYFEFLLEKMDDITKVYLFFAFFGWLKNLIFLN